MKKRYPRSTSDAPRVRRSPRPRHRIPLQPDLRYDVFDLKFAPVEPLHLTLLDLETGHCRYPFGEGPFTFCGCQAIAGGSYCGPHAKLVFNPERDRARGKRLEAAE